MIIPAFISFTLGTIGISLILASSLLERRNKGKADKLDTPRRAIKDS